MFWFLYIWFLVIVGLWISWTKSQTLPNLRLPTSSGSLSRRPLASGGLTLVFFFAVLVVVTLFSFSETHKQTELTAAAEHSERRERERAGAFTWSATAAIGGSSSLGSASKVAASTSPCPFFRLFRVFRIRLSRLSFPFQAVTLWSVVEVWKQWNRDQWFDFIKNIPMI